MKKKKSKKGSIRISDSEFDENEQGLGVKSELESERENDWVRKGERDEECERAK